MTCGWKKPSDPIRLSDQGNTAQYRLMCLNRKSSEKVIRCGHYSTLHCTATLLDFTLLHSTLPTLYTAYTLHCLARHCSGVMMTVHCTPHRVLCSVCTVPSLHCTYCTVYTMFTVQCAQHNAHYPAYIAQHTQCGLISPQFGLLVSSPLGWSCFALHHTGYTTPHYITLH